MFLHYDIITPQGAVASGDAVSISLPTGEGEITILPNHIPLISTLGAGELTIRSEKETTYFATEGGFVEVSNNHISMMADFTARAEALDEDVIEKAKLQAEQNLKTQKFANDEQFAAAAAALERELAKLKVVRRRRG